MAPNGVTTTTEFDAMNRVTSLIAMRTLAPNDPGVALVYQNTYRYDRAGNRRASDETVPGAGHPLHHLELRPALPAYAGDLDRGPRADVNLHLRPCRQPLGREHRRDRVRRTARTDIYVYDYSGGHQGGFRNELYRVYQGSDGTYVEYTYDDNGRRTGREVHPQGAIAPSSVTEYAYGLFNRLTEVETDGATVFQAKYDAPTPRVWKKEGATETIFRYDGGTNFQELNQSDDVLTELVRAGGLGGGIGSVLYSDKSMADPTPGPVEHFVYNAVGHTVGLTDNAGAITQSTTYDAFGQTVHPPRGRQHQQPLGQHQGARRQHQPRQPRVPVLRPGGRAVRDAGPDRVW